MPSFARNEDSGFDTPVNSATSLVDCIEAASEGKADRGVACADSQRGEGAHKGYIPDRFLHVPTIWTVIVISSVSRMSPENQYCMERAVPSGIQICFLTTHLLVPLARFRIFTSIIEVVCINA